MATAKKHPNEEEEKKKAEDQLKPRDCWRTRKSTAASSKQTRTGAPGSRSEFPVITGASARRHGGYVEFTPGPPS